MIYNVKVNGHITVTRNFYVDLQVEAETEDEALEVAQIEASEDGVDWAEDTDGGSWNDFHQEVEVGDAEIESSESEDDSDDQEDL